MIFKTRPKQFINDFLEIAASLGRRNDMKNGGIAEPQCFLVLTVNIYSCNYK